MITDYSSVAFDFAYMDKPVIYYQFDREDFECEYGGSYFDYERDGDGFGPVVSDEEQVVQMIGKFINSDFGKKAIYKQRCKRTFSIRMQEIVKEYMKQSGNCRFSACIRIWRNCKCIRHSPKIIKNMPETISGK